MNKQNFLTLTLIISGLALSPVVAEEVNLNRADMESAPTLKTQQESQSIRSGISTVLYNRGLEKKTADKLATTMLELEDEIYLSPLLETLDEKNIVSKDEVLGYLSTAALYRQTLDLKKYDVLVGMVSKIKQKSLDAHTLKQLSYLAKVSKEVFV